MRLRIPEILVERGLLTRAGKASAYQLSQASGGRLTMTAAWRLVKGKGRMKHYPGALLDLLADVLQATTNELIEFESPVGRKKRKRGTVRANGGGRD